MASLGYKLKKKNVGSVSNFMRQAIWYKLAREKGFENFSTRFNQYLIFKAWNTVTKAEDYTLNQFVSKGVLTCSLSSSLLRDNLTLRKKEIIDKINLSLQSEMFFNPRNKDCSFISDIVLK